MSGARVTSPRVFISYSKDSPEHTERVFELSNRLRGDGINCILDQCEPLPPEGWPRWTRRQLRDADFVLLVCTTTYYRLVMGEEDPTPKAEFRWEGRLLYHYLCEAEVPPGRYIRVLFGGDESARLPPALQNARACRPWTDEGYKELCGWLTERTPAQGALPLRPRLPAGDQPKPGHFDVFLSHKGSDKPAARQLDALLRARGLLVWFDERELIPGRPWQEALEEILRTVRAVAVLIDKDGWGPWHKMEMRSSLSQFASRGMSVIPVLLPGAPKDFQLSTTFLGEFHAVDFREDGLTKEKLDALHRGITDEGPAPRAGPPLWPASPPVPVPGYDPLLEVVANQEFRIRSPKGSHQMPWNLPGLSKRYGKKMRKNAPSWKRVHSLTEELYRVYLDLRLYMLDCVQATSCLKLREADQHRSSAEAHLKAVRPQITRFHEELKKLPPSVSRAEPVRVLCKIPLCTDALKQSLTYAPASPQFQNGLCLVTQIGEWLLSALHMADQALEDYFFHQKAAP